MQHKSTRKSPPKKRGLYVRFEADALKEVHAFLDREYQRTGVRTSLNSFIVRHTLAAVRSKQIELL